MKQSTQYKILSVLTLMLCSLCAVAQAKDDTVQIDTLTKVIGIGLTIGGFYMGYMQMRMAIKIADVEANFNKAIGLVKDNFAEMLRSTQDKLEGKIELSSKEIEAKMATRHDIDNLKTVIKLQHEIDEKNNEGLKEQLKTAANIYKRDKE